MNGKGQDNDLLEYIDSKRKLRKGHVAVVWFTVQNALKQYVGQRPLPFSSIDMDFLESYKSDSHDIYADRHKAQ
ncbi:MAG: phage integrase SAM-like domain-containing protein [Chlorobiales bacterium]|nr:phage integrase SAM-like domain-containing protein [Chlorobiales bacterium]